MLNDSLTAGKAVDEESALEFMKEAAKLASSRELEDLSKRIARKSDRFREILNVSKIETLGEEEFSGVVSLIFTLGRKSNRLIKDNGFLFLRKQIRDLLYGKRILPERFDRFVWGISGIEKKMRINLAGELLHFTMPDRYWLWTNWIWDEDTKTGALPLVLRKSTLLHGETPGESYMMVGKAMAGVDTVGHERGFSRMSHGFHGVDVFLACVYAVYMYTVFQVKLSREFNRILPELPELTRRVLGVQKLEA